MPKEISHLIFSDRALKKIEDTCPDKGQILRKQYNFLLLGSIIPDTAFYDLSLLNKNKSISFLSHRIHGERGSLDNIFLRNVLEEGLKGSDDVFAFCCGIICHQWADMLFHPLIFHLTGNYAHPDPVERRRSQARHRFLEGLVDLKLAELYFPGGEFTPSSIMGRLKAMGSREACFLMFLKSIPVDRRVWQIEETVRKLDKVLLFQLRLLLLYGNTLFKRLILLANGIGSNRLEAHAGLLYGDKSFLSHRMLNEEYYFRDPWSGEEKTASVAGLSEKVIDRTSRSMEKYNDARKNGEHNLPDSFFDDLLPSKCRDESEDMKEEYVSTEEMDALLSRFLEGKG